MKADEGKAPTAQAGHTVVERKSERELVVTRSFNSEARLLFAAWSDPKLMMQWWVPKSTGMTLLSCATDVRTGGSYRFEFNGTPPMVFFGKYTDVVPNARIVWTNEESSDGAVSTLTFEERQGKTMLTLHEAYPSKEALDMSFDGMEMCMPEQLNQLEALLDKIKTSA